MTENKMMEELRDFFLYVKKIEDNFKYVFLSERFFKVYQYLMQEYPEIILPSSSLYDDNSSTKYKKLYLNDINYENFPKHRAKDRVFLYSFCFNYSCINLEKQKIRVVEKDRQISMDSQKFIKYYLKNQNQKSICWKRKVVGKEVLETLGIELELLEKSGIQDPIYLLPDFLQTYFRFIQFNQQYLNFFLKSFYENQSLNNRSICDITDTIVNDMMHRFGRENISSELVQFLLEQQKWGYFHMNHYPLNQGIEFEKYNVHITENGNVKKIGTLKG